MAIIDNPVAVSGGEVDQTSALQWMLNNRTNYNGIAAGLTSLTELPTFTQTTTNIFNYMFSGCSNLRDASALTMGSSIQGEYMFNGCTSLETAPDFSNSSSIVYASYMFNNCSKLTTLNLKNNVLNNVLLGTVAQMFSGCTKLTTINSSNTLRLPGISHVSNFISMFSGCGSLQNITLSGKFGTKVGEVKTSYMFQNCTKLTTISATSGWMQYVSEAYAMFKGCTALTSVQTCALDNCTSAYQMFTNCTNLTTSPISNTNKITNFSNIFNGCSSLSTVSAFNMAACSGATNHQAMFSGCSSLSNTALNNILATITTATSVTSNKTLKYIGLTSAQATTCTGLSNWAAAEAAGWTTGY